MIGALALLIAPAVVIFMTWVTSPKATRQSLRANPGLIIGLILGYLAITIAVKLGGSLLAAWLYDTSAPDRDQIRIAHMLILSPIAAPVLFAAAWVYWHARRDRRRLIRRSMHEARLVEPSKEYRVQAAENER